MTTAAPVLTDTAQQVREAFLKQRDGFGQPEGQIGGAPDRHKAPLKQDNANQPCVELA